MRDLYIISIFCALMVIAFKLNVIHEDLKDIYNAMLISNNNYQQTMLPKVVPLKDPTCPGKLCPDPINNY